MASHLQLLGMGIVDQLANLESSLISMFLESSLRLAHVINADFFILVETPSGGRRIAGSDKLCREFTDGNLIGNCADVRARLKDDAVPIFEESLAASEDETVEGHPGASSDLVPDVRNAGPSPTDAAPVAVGSPSVNNATFQRPSIADEDNFPNGVNQVNPFNNSSNCGGTPANSFTPNSIALRSISQRHFDCSSPGGGGVVVVGNKRSQESLPNGVSSAKRLRSNDFDVVGVDANESALKFECFDDDVEVIPHHYQGQDPYAVNLFPQHPQPTAGYPSSAEGTGEYDFTEVRNYLNENGKVACIVNQLATGELDLSKQSKEMRILGSIMYDLGKMLSRQVKIPDKCHPETKRHFTQAYDVIWAGIPGIDAYSRSQGNSSLGDHFRGLSLKAFLRCQLYSAFKNSLARTLRKMSAPIEPN